VSFALVNTDVVGSNLYTQISAYVNNVGTDIVDIINISYDQAPAASPTPSPAMSLLWQDDFNGNAGTGPSSTIWNADLEDGCSSGNCGWGNGEREWYTSAANKLNGSSNLVITANKLSANTAPNCYYGKCEWSSGKITTYNKVNFTYGYLEARIKNPAGGGTWPAFWMLGNDIAIRPWPLCGEIDIMEGEGNAPYTNWGTAHWANTNQWDHIQGPGNNTVSLSSKLSDAYHTYGILWTPTSLTWYVDGTANYTLNKASVPNSLWPFGPTSSGADPKFYAIFNVAMGGGMGGNIDPALTSTSMTIDYLKYYSVNGQGKVTLLP
jgi:beta-glucanase (GH16 family)